MTSRLVWLLVVSGMACKRPAARRAPDPTLADTLRGVVSVVGTDRERRVVLRVPGQGGVSVVGDQAALVGRVAGAEVWVAGTRADVKTASRDPDFTVSRFAVRTVDGQPAIDGTVTVTGDTVAIVTGDGVRHTLGHAPAELRARPGARVWITGRMDAGAVTYGFIDPPR